MEQIPQLGQPIISADRLYRRKGHGSHKWMRVGELPGIKPKPVKGVFAGYRTYANGEPHYDSDGWTYFVPTEHIRVWLIIPHPSQKAIPVLPEDCGWPIRG